MYTRCWVVVNVCSAGCEMEDVHVHRYTHSGPTLQASGRVWVVYTMPSVRGSIQCRVCGGRVYTVQGVCGREDTSRGSFLFNNKAIIQ